MRTVLAVVGWFTAAAAAIGVGLAGIQAIGSGITTGAGDVKSPAEVSRELALSAPSPSLSSPPSPSSSPSSSPSAVPLNVRPFSGTGGTVTAGCLPAGVFLISWTPAQGYGVDRVDRGPA